jgi:uncharacterized membrane protein YhaH (DUF805 family)
MIANRGIQLIRLQTKVVSMTFSQSISSVFSKYATFKGRATRSEYWHFVLFYIVGIFTCIFLDITLFGHNPNNRNGDGGVLIGLFTILVLLPFIAVSVRRFHDIGLSGWVVLLSMVPILNFVTLYWTCQPSTPGANRYGPAAASPAIGPLPVLHRGDRSLEDEVRQLKKLLDGGLVTEQEFNEGKRKILGI